MNCTILSLRDKFTAYSAESHEYCFKFHQFTFLVKALVFLEMNYLSFTYRCEVWWLMRGRIISDTATEWKRMIRSISYLHQCLPWGKYGRSTLGVKPPKIDRQPIKVYKLQWNVDNGRQRRLNLVRISLEPLMKNSEESLMLSLLSLRQSVTLISVIFKLVIYFVVSWLKLSGP